MFDPPFFSALLCRCPTSSSPYCHGLLINGKASGSPHRRGETQKLRGKCLEGSPRAEPPPSVRPVDRREEETRLLLLSNAGGRSCGCSGPSCTCLVPIDRTAAAQQRSTGVLQVASPGLGCTSPDHLPPTKRTRTHSADFLGVGIHDEGEPQCMGSSRLRCPYRGCPAAANNYPC